MANEKSSSESCGVRVFRGTVGAFHAILSLTKRRLFMKNDSKAIMLDNGLVVCESCGAELECNHETGDMPDVCPECGKTIDWSDFFMVL